MSEISMKTQIYIQVSMDLYWPMPSMPLITYLNLEPIQNNHIRKSLPSTTPCYVKFVSNTRFKSAIYFSSLEVFRTQRVWKFDVKEWKIFQDDNGFSFHHDKNILQILMWISGYKYIIWLFESIILFKDILFKYRLLVLVKLLSQKWIPPT